MGDGVRPRRGGNRALKRPHPIDCRRLPHRSVVGANRRHRDRRSLGPRDLDDARWDLTITPGEQAGVKLLTERAYRAKFPTAKTQVRHPLARFDGTVALGDTVTLDGWTGSVNHNWGRKHTPAYAFGQVCGFDGNPSSSLEIVTAHAALGPLRLPAATLFVLRHARPGGRRALGSGRQAHAGSSTSRSGGRSAAASTGSRCAARSAPSRRRDRADLHRHRRRVPSTATTLRSPTAGSPCPAAGSDTELDRVAAGDVRDPHRPAKPQRGAAGVSPLLNLDRALNPCTHDGLHDYASSSGAGGFGTSAGPAARRPGHYPGRETSRHPHDARVAWRFRRVGGHARRAAVGRRSAPHRGQGTADSHLLAATDPR